MLFIDIHTHGNTPFEDVLSVQNIFPGDSTDLSSGKLYSAGLHPWFIKSESENENCLAQLKKMCRSKQVVAIGECGLDKKIATPFELQGQLFAEQVQMAEAFKLPVIIHSVKAYNELISINKKMKPDMPWILHGYSGNPQISAQLLKLNFFFSFGKSLLKNHLKTVNSFLLLPKERIFFETDEYQGSVREIYEHARTMLNIPLVELVATIKQNFNKIFPHNL